jgi:hypothetical protein
MTARSTAEAAEHLWMCASHHSGAPADVSAAVGRLCSELATVLGRWIGADGFRALLQRAYAIARTPHPVLDGFSCLGGKQTESTAVAVQMHGAEEVAAGIVALLTALIELLGRIIGEEMAMHLVAQIEIPSSRAVAKVGSEENGNG